MIVRTAIALLSISSVLACAQDPRRNADATDMRSASSTTGPVRAYALTADEDIYDISPDGRYAGYIDWKTGNLMVREIANGAIRDLTHKGTYEMSADEAESALFSPDGSLVAYEWYNDSTGLEEVRVVGMDGSRPRSIMRGVHGASLWPDTWTPDGKGVVTIVDDTAGGRIVQIAPIEGGDVKTLPLARTSLRPMGFTFSPDGRYLAYATARETSSARTDIYLLDTASGQSHILVKSDAPSQPVAWRNNRLVFVSERAGTPGIWYIGVTRGKANGDPVLVRGEVWGLNHLRLTDSGKYYYTVSAGDRDVYTAAFDFNTGKELAPPVSLTHRPGENYRQVSWSDDGQFVAYITRHQGPLSHRLTIRALDGSEFREFEPDLGDLQLVRWVPKRNMLMLGGSDELNVRGVFQLDLKNGSLRKLAGIGATAFGFSADGSTMYYCATEKRAEGMRSILRARNLDNGNDRELASLPEGKLFGGSIFVTDGGKTVLASGANARSGYPLYVYAVPADGTHAVTDITRPLPIEPGESWRPIGVSPDGSSLLMAERSLREPNWTSFWRVPLHGGAPVKLGPAPAGITTGLQNIASWVSPDGRRIAYTAGTLTTELWMLNEPSLAK
jgi:Tol biopolymer transport system component